VDAIENLALFLSVPHTLLPKNICACVPLSGAKQIENENIFKLISKTDKIGN